jgi:hypothetical protein
MEALKQYWALAKQYWYVGFLLVAALGFVFGRFSSVAETKTEYVEKEKVIYQDRIVEKIVEKKAETKVVYVEKTKVTKPDGTVEEKETSKSESKSDSERQSDRTKEVVVYRDREVEKRVSVILQPRWYVGAAVGYDGSPGFLRIPTAPNLAIGIEAKIRLVGPIWLGALATNTGTFAGTVGATF